MATLCASQLPRFTTRRMRHLIAAAPQLLAALTIANEAVDRLLSTGRFDRKDSLPAIARAQYAQELARAALALAQPSPVRP